MVSLRGGGVYMGSKKSDMLANNAPFNELLISSVRKEIAKEVLKFLGKSPESLLSRFQHFLR